MCVCVAEKPRQSGLNEKTRETNREESRGSEAAAQVAKSNRDDASPKGESNPLEGTSLGHFRLVLVRLPTR